MSEYDSMPHELGWDDEIQNDGSPFQILPEGDYRFTVNKFERARHSGSEKIPACNKAILTLTVFNGEAPGDVQTNLFLHSKFEWKLCQFFVAIGQRKHGEAMRMNWGAVTGSGGVCHVDIRKWAGNDGKERESNEITEFYDPESAPQVEDTQPPRRPQPRAGLNCPRAPPRPGATAFSKWSLDPISRRPGRL